MIIKTFEKQNKTGGPIFLWGCFPHRGNDMQEEVDRMWELMKERLQDRPFMLYAYQVEDWNRDLSPWAADAVMGDEGFAGKGPETLEELEKSILPKLQKLQTHSGSSVETADICGAGSGKIPGAEMPDAGAATKVKTKAAAVESRPIILMGYSLAGLFSLWAAYESEAFAGVICGSGSLWFPGWMEYAKARKLKSRGPVYLSLGGKEEKTANQVMARIGCNTREQLAILERDENAVAATLEMNSGGHFADSQKRLAKGIRWISKYLY